MQASKLMFLHLSSLAEPWRRQPIRPFVDVGLFGIGSGALNLMEALGPPLEDEWFVMSCAGVAAACVVGLLAFWVWLVRTYGGPAAAKPTDAAKTGRPSWEG